MPLKNQIADNYVEIIGLAIFLLCIYNIVVILFMRPLSELDGYIAILALSVFLMSYKNLPHHVSRLFTHKN